MAAAAPRYLQPAIFQRVCRDILELQTCDISVQHERKLELSSQGEESDVHEMNNDDDEAWREYVSDITDDLQRVLPEHLPATRAEQDALLRTVFDLLYDGARSDYEITVGEWDAQLTMLGILRDMEAMIEIREFDDPNINRAAERQFINELRALMVFMGADPADRNPEEDQELYQVFLALRNRMPREHIKARIMFAALQREGEASRWRNIAPNVEEKIVSYLKGGANKKRKTRKARKTRKTRKVRRGGRK